MWHLLPAPCCGLDSSCCCLPQCLEEINAFQRACGKAKTPAPPPPQQQQQRSQEPCDCEKQ